MFSLRGIRIRLLYNIMSLTCTEGKSPLKWTSVEDSVRKDIIIWILGWWPGRMVGKNHISPTIYTSYIVKQYGLIIVHLFSIKNYWWISFWYTPVKYPCWQANMLMYICICSMYNIFSIYWNLLRDYMELGGMIWGEN